MRYFNYLKYVLLHKWFVYQAYLIYRKSFSTTVSFWQIIWHDFDKFYPHNFIPYARTFYKSDGSKQYDETTEFNLAWLRHQKLNKHHYQYWVVIMDRGEVVPLEIPKKYFDEMLIDWMGASWANNGSPYAVIDWWSNTRESKRQFIYESDFRCIDLTILVLNTLRS